MEGKKEVHAGVKIEGEGLKYWVGVKYIVRGSACCRDGCVDMKGGRKKEKLLGIRDGSAKVHSARGCIFIKKGDWNLRRGKTQTRKMRKT